MSRFAPDSFTDPAAVVQVLDESGELVNQQLVPESSDREFLEMYRHMKFARRFDTKAISLQRQGRLGTYPPIAGHEGAQIASTLALEKHDWVVPTYRESGVPLVRGVPAKEVLRYWMGHEGALLKKSVRNRREYLSVANSPRNGDFFNKAVLSENQEPLASR